MSEEETNSIGRPEIIIDEVLLKKAEGFASNGLNQKELAFVLGMGESTFYEKIKEFPELMESIEVGRAKGVAVIKNKFFEKAKDGDNHCMTLYLKNNSDLKDRHDIEHGGAITHEHEGISRAAEILADFARGRQDNPSKGTVQD